MKKITFKPNGANTHQVFADGVLVGEFRFIRDRVITTPHGKPGPRVCNIVTAGTLTDFISKGDFDLACFSWFKDVKKHVAAHFNSRAARLRPITYTDGQNRFSDGDMVRLKKAVADGDDRPVPIRLLYGDIDGGVRLDEERNGFISWNVNDLEKVLEKVVDA